MTVLSRLKNHSAELVLESADRDFEKVATMCGISQFFHFTFKGENTVFMSQLPKDPSPTCAYKVLNEYTDGRNPVRKVDRVLVDEVLYESDLILYTYILYMFFNNIFKFHIISFLFS